MSDQKELKQLTLAEVEQHNTDDDCWLIIDNKVYDVSKYLDEHPGGPEVMADLAGEFHSFLHARENIYNPNGQLTGVFHHR